MPWTRRSEPTRLAVQDFPWPVRRPIRLSDAAMSSSGHRVAMLRITASAASGVLQPCSPVLGFLTRSSECRPPFQWITRTTQAFKTLGSKLQAGELLDLEALGLQRHLSVLSSDEELLGIGFTRALGLGQIRETLKQIEAKWAY